MTARAPSRAIKSAGGFTAVADTTPHQTNQEDNRTRIDNLRKVAADSSNNPELNDVALSTFRILTIRRYWRREASRSLRVRGILHRSADESGPCKL